MNAQTTPTIALKLCLSTEAGSMERLLRVIRVRGFEIVDMRLQLDATAYDLELSIRGQRDPQNLCEQLRKLPVVSCLTWPEAAMVESLALASRAG